MSPQEWPWVLARSTETGWAQLPPPLQADGGPQGVVQNVAQMLAQLLQMPGGQVLVAREGGRPVGYLVVGVVPDEITGQPTGLYCDIYVESPWRGRGVSSLLTGAGDAYCRQLGLRHVRRWVAAHNQSSLRHALADGCQVERVGLIKAL